MLKGGIQAAAVHSNSVAVTGAVVHSRLALARQRERTAARGAAMAGPPPPTEASPAVAPGVARDNGSAGGGASVRSAGPSSKWELAEALANAQQASLIEAAAGSGTVGTRQSSQASLSATGGASSKLGGSKGLSGLSPGGFTTPTISRSFQRGRSESSVEEDAAEVEPSPVAAAPATKSRYSSAVESLDYEVRHSIIIYYIVTIAVHHSRQYM